MALQATLLGLAGLATAAALLCALVLMWWALGTRGAPPASARDLKPGPFDNDAPTPSPGAQVRVDAGPTDLDLDIDFRAFRAQIRHDLEALQAQIGRRCDVTFQEDDDEDDEDLGIDFEAFQAQVGRRCDLELGALCERALDDQSAKVLRDLEDEFRGGPVGAQAAVCQPASAEPGMDFEVVEANVEGMWSDANDAIDRALDGMCAAMFKALEDECRGSSAPDYVNAAVCPAAWN